MALKREVTERTSREAALRRNDVARRGLQERQAVAAERERIAAGLHDTVIHGLHKTGLDLHTAVTLADGDVRQRILDAIDQLDETIRRLQLAVFSWTDNQSADAHAPDASGLRPTSDSRRDPDGRPST